MLYSLNYPLLKMLFHVVIYESLFYGCPVLCTAGKTPWDKLNDLNAGWNLNINKPYEFVDCIDQLISNDNSEYQSFINGCSIYLNSEEKSIVKNDNINLFN